MAVKPDASPLLLVRDLTVNFDSARGRVRAVAGGGWRLPTMAELKAIYQKDASDVNMDPLFQAKGAWAWSGELRNDWSVWGLAFYNNLEGWHSMNYGNGRVALAVRSRR